MPDGYDIARMKVTHLMSGEVKAPNLDAQSCTSDSRDFPMHKLHI
jgi:hypothetical protein